LAALVAYWFRTGCPPNHGSGLSSMISDIAGQVQVQLSILIAAIQRNNKNIKTTLKRYIFSIRMTVAIYYQQL
jgi:hypothetical protein